MRSTSATRSRRWKGLDSTLASFGARESGCSATAAKPVMNMILSDRIELGRPPRQLDAVHLRHDDIGQQQVEGRLLDLLEGARAFAERDDGMAGALQRAHQKPAHILVIFSQNDLGHASPWARARYRRLRSSSPTCQPRPHR